VDEKERGGAMSADVQPAIFRPDAPPKPWTRTRITGWCLVAFWLLVFLALALFLYGAYDPEKFDKYYPKYLSGLGVTLELVAVAMICGALLSFPIAYMRMSKNRILSRIGYAYVYFFRGTPLLAQTFLIYYGFGQFHDQIQSIGLWWFFKDAWNCGVFAFTLNTAAYQAEILAGAIQSVGKGQWEGAAALGIPKYLTFFKIILPQALIVALRPYGNELILMLKGSAVLSLITVYDLMGETRRAFSRGYDFQMYIWAAVIYFAMVETLRNIWDAMERRLTRHLIR
jgi:polar amino acid transport system permease protein